MKNLLCITFILIMTGTTYSQLFENFNVDPFANGQAITTLPLWGTGTVDQRGCQDPSYLVANNMQARCADFPNVTGDGNFMIVDSDHTWASNIIYQAQIDPGYPAGLYTFAITGIDRVQNGNGVPLDDVLDIFIDGNWVGSVTIYPNDPWFEKTVVNIPLNQNPQTLTILQATTRLWNDYAIDNITLCYQNPQSSFDIIDIHGQPRIDFCPHDPVLLDGTNTIGEREYRIDICARPLGSDPTVQCAPWNSTGWVTGQVGVHDLLQVWQINHPDWWFWPGNVYYVTLAISNQPCTDYVAKIKIFEVECLPSPGNGGGDIKAYSPSDLVNSSAEYDVVLSEFTEASERLENRDKIVSKAMIYPNPADSEVIFALSHSPLSEVSIYDNSGRRILHLTDLSVSSKAVDISKFKKGLYLVQILDSEGQIYYEKLMVQ